MRLSARLSLVLTLVAGTALGAQQPVAAGTATGLGLGAMTEARFGEAALWNPALGGIFDGPMRSYSLLTGTARTSDVRRSLDQYGFFQSLSKDSIRVIEGPTRTKLESLVGSDLALVNHDFAMQWIGLQARELTIAVTTYGHSDLRVPQRAIRIATAEPTAITNAITGTEQAEAIANPSRDWLATVVAVGRADDLGMQPLLGHVWVGATAKYTLVHHTSLGHWEYAAATDVNSGFGGLPYDGSARSGANDVGAVNRTVEVDGVRIYGADIGMAMNPSPPLLLSFAVSNIFQKARVSTVPADLHERIVGFAGLDSAGHTRSFGRDSTLNPADALRPWFADAEYLARSAKFTPTFRAGASLETWAGRVTAGYAHRLQGFASLDDTEGARASVAWMAPRGALRPRASYSVLFDGSSVIGLGLMQGWCSSRLSLGANLLRRTNGTREIQASFGWAQGEAPCGIFR